jgi:hypothetical protein
MSATVIRSPQDFLVELKKLADEKKVVAPPQLTNEELTAEIEKLGAALDAGSAAGSTLVGAVREVVEAQRRDLIRQQYILLRGFVPDENGNRPVDEKAIAAKVIETISAAPQSESTELQSELEPPDDEEDDEYEEEFDLGEQIEVLNEIDEADASDTAVAEIPAMSPLSERVLVALTFYAAEHPKWTHPELGEQDPNGIHALVAEFAAQTVPLQQVQRGAVLLEAEIVALLKATMAADLPHVTAKVLTMALGK